MRTDPPTAAVQPAAPIVLHHFPLSGHSHRTLLFLSLLGLPHRIVPVDFLKGGHKTPAFLALTMAAALNDVGSWALVSWQATFYQRVYDLQPDTYAPMLAVIIPVGGVIGGVGAGVFGDWLNRIGARGWLTAGSAVLAAPIIAVSLLAPDYKQSFAALLVGFALR